MAKNSRNTRRDTRSIKVVRIGKRIHVRIPQFLSPPFYILCSTILFIILLFPYTTTVQTFDLPKLGEASKETIIAPFTFDIIRSAEELEKERKKAMEQVLLVLDYDPEIRKNVHNKLLEVRNNVQKTINDDTPDSVKDVINLNLSRELSENSIKAIKKRPYLVDDAIFQAGDILDKGVSAVLLVPTLERLNELKAIYNTSFDQHLFYDRQFVSLRRDSMEVTVRHYELPVKEIALENAIKDLREDRKFDDEALNTIYEILFVYIRPNIKVNGAATMQRRQKASQGVLEISGKVIKDTEIVRKHQEVTSEIIQKLRSLRIAMDRMVNIQEKRKIKAGNTGRLLLGLLPLLFAAFYIRKFNSRLLKSNVHLIALALVLIIQVLIIRVGIFITPRLFEGSSELSMLVPEYIVPVITGSVLTAILFNLELGFMMTLFVSMFYGIVMGFNHFFFIYSFLGGTISCFLARNIRYRWHFFKIIPPVVLIFIIIISLWHLIGFKLSVLTMFLNFGLTLISVIVAIFLAMMFTPIFERLFDITTDMTLVELSDMNHPILKRLSIEAAGTYNHSVLVGNLAESAAQRIGANPLLARVAAYYHDIGKIEKSDYFVENCLTIDRNRHNKLSPSMSALIICSHVKDGIELAKKYKLPKVIQDVIMQHHGTTSVSFFYEKALEQDPHKQVKEQDFCYPGPEPQTRETAIIMLADSVEAASRSLGTSSPKLLRELVKKIIKDKFLSSQLDQSNLTLRDLDEIVEGFMPVLQGIFHSRIEYPSKEKGV
ncbi:MAG TPA: HDIG domain-containing protein [Chitinispirillaceae bacterium]|nr:HDIG domain-containing protein [Chitinispirillaceae bacterium]